MIRASGVMLIIGVDLEVALNYGMATGSPPLIRFLTEHTEVGFFMRTTHFYIQSTSQEMCHILTAN